MDATAAQNPQLLLHYEGLVRKTAGRLVRTIGEQQAARGFDNYVEEDFDDVCQFLRYKVWKALLAFNPDNLRKKPSTRKGLNEARDKYVFSCLVNAKVDVLKKKRHNPVFIESVAPSQHVEQSGGHHTVSQSWFEERYLCVEDAFEEIADGMTLPSTLTDRERSVLLLLYLHFKPAEIALQIAVPRAEVASITKGIREKMADWSPGSPERVPLAA